MTIDLLRCALPAAPPPFDIGRVDHHFVVSAALEALGAARGEPDRAGPALSRWFRRARRLGSKDRRLVAEMVYDTLRHEGILTRDGATDDAARIERWKGLVGGDRMEGLPATTPEADYATALSLPLEIATEWLDVLGEEGAAALGAALSERAPTTLRANRVRCTPQQLAKRLAEEGIETTPTAQATDGLHVLTRANFPALRSFKEGWFEVQDEASQLLCAAIGARRGLSVLDFCAGAGGKSLALAATGADVRAHDVRPRVLQELHKRAKRADVKVSVGPPKPADVVLVDAPCSGSGRLRRDPALRLGLPLMDLGGLIKLQRGLIAQGSKLVKPGGRLVYSTCSMLSAEHHQELAGWVVEEERMLWPSQGGTDGFHWCIWRRAGEA